MNQTYLIQFTVNIKTTAPDMRLLWFLFRSRFPHEEQEETFIKAEKQDKTV